MRKLTAGGIIVKYFTIGKMYQFTHVVTVISIKTDWSSSEIVSFIYWKASKNWVIGYLQDHKMLFCKEFWLFESHNNERSSKSFIDLP